MYNALAGCALKTYQVYKKQQTAQNTKKEIFLYFIFFSSTYPCKDRAQQHHSDFFINVPVQGPCTAAAFSLFSVPVQGTCTASFRFLLQRTSARNVHSLIQMHQSCSNIELVVSIQWNYWINVSTIYVSTYSIFFLVFQ